MSGKLLPNQVIIRDSNNGLSYMYDIDDREEYAFLSSRGTWDESGNLCLSTPLIAAIKRFTLDSVMANIDKYEKTFGIPDIIVGFEPKDSLKLENVSEYSNSQLEEYLAIFGGYRAYLEAQLAYIESRRGILEAGVEEGTRKMLYQLEQEYQDKKKPNKEALHGEAVANNPSLKDLKKQYIEETAISVIIRGKLQAVKAAYDAASRVVALRSLSREMA